MKPRTQTIAPITARTQLLHQVPHHQRLSHSHLRITPTTTPRITPIHPLHTLKHLPHTITLPQRPAIRSQTPQCPHTRRVPNPQTHTRLHPHHRQPPPLPHRANNRPSSESPNLRRSHHPTPTPRQYTSTTAFRCERNRRISAPRLNGASNGVLNPTPLPSTNTTGAGNGVSGVP